MCSWLRLCPAVLLSLFIFPAALSVLLTGGCSSSTVSTTPGDSIEAPTRGGPASPSASHFTPPANDLPAGSDIPRRRRPSVATYSARAGSAQRLDALTSAEAMGRMLSIVRESIEFAPTLVVWLVDVSPSAMQWGSDLQSDIRQFYIDVVPSLVAKQPDRLQSAMLTISRHVQQVVPLTSDPAQVVRGIDALRREESGREVTFQAVKQAIGLSLPIRLATGREVLVVIITDEAGDDWRLVDELVEQPRKYALPIYVVGVPAPFGRSAALDASVELPVGGPGSAKGEEEDEAGGSWQPILQGPESRYLQRISLRFERLDHELEILDSGFGPFALQRLCRASGGDLLAVRRADGGSTSFSRARRDWPTSEIRSYDPEVMRRYLPDDVDEAGYQALLAENRACMALHRAAQLAEIEVLRDPQLHFVKRDEADLKNRLDKAQQAAAKVAPAVERLYDLLSEGAADAGHLASPRWQAGFDLALGRVCAAKSRIDGYNSMLAALKRGKAFERSDSTTWVLRRAATTRSSSSLESLAERARTLLQRVVDQHPHTPWAQLAGYELETPLGWEWTEQP